LSAFLSAAVAMRLSRIASTGHSSSSSHVGVAGAFLLRPPPFCLLAAFAAA
jgi:hypothetical protein